MNKFSGSTVGYAPNHTPQIVTIGSSVTPMLKKVTHELFHALGRSHEHQRADRDEFVRINWNNIFQGG